MNSYAVIAFATPVAAVLLGWAAVALHRRSLRRSHDAEVQGGGTENDVTAAAMRTWHLHGIIDGSPSTAYRGAPEAHRECQRLAAAMHNARRAFRDATLAGDFGAAISAELAWCTGATGLRRVLATLRRPKLQPFTPEEIDAAVLGIRRDADAMFDREPEDELEEEEPDEWDDDG